MEKEEKATVDVEVKRSMKWALMFSNFFLMITCFIFIVENFNEGKYLWAACFAVASYSWMTMLLDFRKCLIISIKE